MANTGHKDDEEEGEENPEENEEVDPGASAAPAKISPKDPKNWCGATFANNTVVTLTPEVPRETWDKKVEFLLAVIGFAVDLGNVWRFPYICLQNGGGAFLIPYCIMLIFGGLPLFYMELALGQFHRCGCLTIWKRICPALKGIGYAICLIDIYMGMYYNTIIGWAVYYFFASFSWELPWTTCDADWSTSLCAPTNDTSKNDSSLPAKEYYERKVLEMQNGNGLDDVGAIKWELALCVLAVFLLVYFSLWKGVKSTGKAVWVTALAPYVVLFILLARGATLPGAADGILYYLTPDCSKLLDKKVWIDAASQIFFSLGPGFGTLLALSSYNKFNNNCYRDAILTSSINCLTSFLAGFVIFSGLGYMAHIQNKKIDQLDKEGPGLVFIVYPAAIATMPFSSFWSIIFFLMLITLGLDSTFGGLEAMITALCDEYPKLLGKHREIFVAVLLMFIYICALPTTTYGGAALVDLLNDYGPSISILFVVFVEAAGVFWFYGVNRFSDDIEKMLGFRPGIFWRVCWSYISPLFLLSVCIFSLTASEDIENLKYPRWSVKIGWILTASSLVCIPLYMAYSIAVTPGNLVQRLSKVLKPEERPDHLAANYNCNYGTGCHTTWDGIRCWPRSKPGDLAVAPCPEYISGFDSKENATKLCTKNGWWVKQDLNVTWTNYTGCYHNTPYLGLTPFDVQLPTSPMVKSYIPTVKLISQIGYSVSLITLLLAFAILAFNKRLRCPRNLLHLHLFVSFIMRAFMALLKDNLFVEGVGFRRNVFYLDGELVFTFLYHKWECKIFTVFWQYFILANYSWILMEGIYLHNLTFMAMFFDTSSIFWHVATGWTLPSVFVIPWAIVRAVYEDTFCWTTHTNKIYFYIIKTPIIVSILVNLILFINIIRVLLKKLNSTTPSFLEPRVSRYRKWAKSTLILMPLYGVHYALLLGMSYSDDPVIEIVWLICDQLFGSSQGFCVALLYCILNGEVMNEMSRKWFLLREGINASKLRKNSSFQSKEVCKWLLTKTMGSLPDDESFSQDEDVMGLTGRLLDFAPGVTGEQLTEEQETALKKATVYFYKQLMLQQQNKSNQLPHISLVSSSSDMCRICREAGSKEDLLTTCRCKGTMRFIHLSCLEHWLAESDSTKCELCSFPYQTVRTPKYSVIKSIILWLQNPGRRRDAREIMLDFLALIVFTPMAFFGTYMALLAAETWYNAEDSVLVSPTLTRIVSLGCLGVIGAIDTAYLSWLLLRAQHHARAWHRWRRRNSVVKVILSPPKAELSRNEEEICSTQLSSND